MSDKPILFSGEMVRAILDGRKTMTRRVMKPQPIEDKSYVGGFGWNRNKESCVAVGAPHIGAYCPYGNWEGSRMWVRETWALWGVPDNTVQIAYNADDSCVTYQPTLEDANKMRDTYIADNERRPHSAENWRPSIFMPRWASRLTLEIVDVRVERVQDISDADCEREGVNLTNASIAGYVHERFKKLWDSINDKRGFGLETNPWVWVISFRVLRRDMPIGQ